MDSVQPGISISQHIYEAEMDLKSKGLKPKYIVVGVNQYNEILENYGVTAIVTKVGEMEIILLDQSNFFDVLPELEAVYSRRIKKP